MKKLITIILAMALIQTANAQAPQKMSYQSVIRNVNDELLTEANVGIQISILQGSPAGAAAYVETHTPMTNINGLVSLEIGMGTPVAGIFADIDWSNGPYFIQTETDPIGGTNYTISGVGELLSVPYALYANEGGGVVFRTNENVTSNANGNYGTDDFVFGSPQLNDDGILTHNARMFFDKSKGAFRAGRTLDHQWDDIHIGVNSTALGYACIASGASSTALGLGSYATAIATTALGNSSSATAPSATAIGLGSIASGNGSMAIGYYTTAPSFAEIAIGSYNTNYIPNGSTVSVSLDRLFVLGNGISENSKSDAMVVLKNGNTGIGESNPHELLEIGGDGRAFFGDGGGGNRKGLLIDGTWLPTATRIESYNYTNGQGLDLVFNDIGNGDVGIKVSNPNVSLDVSGSIEYTGTITDVSDERLKENFKTIENPLVSISQIQGYSYNMKDDEDQVREYGVIAQEIQKVFPELVTVVDEETGYLGVSYVQLIPILLEGIKEQQKELEELKLENAEVKATNQVLKIENENNELRLENHETRLEQNTKLLHELKSILKAQASK